MPPQTAEFLQRFESASCMPEDVDGQCVRTSYPSARHELEAAAKWARAQLEIRGQGANSPPHRRRRSRAPSPPRRSGARVLARDAARLQPPGRSEDADAVQRLPRQAFAQLPPGRRRAQSPRARAPERGLPGRELPHPLALPRARRHRTRAPRDAGREAAQGFRRDRHAREAHRRRPAGAATAKSARARVRNLQDETAIAGRVGAPLLRAPGSRRLPRRAHARLGRVPDARQVARSLI